MDGFDLGRSPTLPRNAPASPQPAKGAEPVRRASGNPNAAAHPAAVAAPAPVRAKPTATPARSGLEPSERLKAPARTAAPGRANPLAALAAKSPNAAPARPKPPPLARKAGPPPRAKPAGLPAKPAASRPQAVSARGLTDQRIAELHTRLVDAKRQTREGGNVSVTGLAKSLRAAETKLRKQHNNRNVDFDIVIKNGRAIVKPFLR
jgi:hypothetical protein